MDPLTFLRMHRASSCVGKLSALVLIVIFVTGSNSTLEIDFRTVHVSEPLLKIVGGTGSGGGIGGPGKSSLQPVSVSVVDSESATCDKTVRYASVEVLNTGASALTIPTSTDGAAVVQPNPRGGPDVRFDMLNVNLRSRRNPALFVTRLLYGNARVVPESQLSLPPSSSILFRNIALDSHGGDLCGADLMAEIAFSTNEAVKSGDAYSLISHETWRVQSR